LRRVPWQANGQSLELASTTNRLLSEAARETLMLLDDLKWSANEKTAAEVERVLLPLAARYSLVERTPEGRPGDPVARFHLGNGARLERLNFLGD
ncbi:malonyl-CoA decarboxylase domain-containing protein, partial [Rhizobium ruizarguesonis]